MDSPFEVLGLDADADDEEVKEAYRQRVKDAHPDHGGSVAEFQVVRAAYEAIKEGDTYDPGDRTEDADDRTDAEEAEEEVGTRVEYLNYEVLDDYGWDLGDEDLFEKASAAGLDPVDYGRFVVQPDEYLLEAAENRGFAWPFACRGGACANCAVAVCDGGLEMPSDHILPPRMTESGIRLSCLGVPTTEELQVVYNVKHLPALDELRLPPDPFERAHGSD